MRIGEHQSPAGCYGVDDSASTRATGDMSAEPKKKVFDIEYISILFETR